MSQELSASLEDYLEEILALEQRDKHAHVRDIAKRLKVKMPSVTGALRSLAARKLVNHRPYGVVTLTGKGRRVAEAVTKRHRLLSAFFKDILGVDAKIAGENACRMEHFMDDDVLERLASYVEFAQKCPLQACTWEGGFGRFHEHGVKPENCERRLDEMLAEFRRRNKGDLKVEHLTLDRIKPGQKARIVKVRAKSGPTNQRLLDMGVTRGTVVEVQRVAPLGDPIEIKIKGYHLSLRKQEAKGISVKPEPESTGE